MFICLLVFYFWMIFNIGQIFLLNCITLMLREKAIKQLIIQLNLLFKCQIFQLGWKMFHPSLFLYSNLIQPVFLNFNAVLFLNKEKKKDRDKTYNKYIIKSLWTEKPWRNLSLESTMYRPDFRFQKLLSCWTSRINIIKVVVLFSFLFFSFLK